MTVEVRINQGTRRAEVLKTNVKTWWVRLQDVNHIKRHKVKHGVDGSGAI